jgi:hypothetical protein
MEHSLYVVYFYSGAISGSAARRGCNGQNGSLFLKIRSTCSGDLDDADVERILREQLADPSQRAAAGRHSQTLWNTSALILFLLRRSARRFPRTVKVGACF